MVLVSVLFIFGGTALAQDNTPTPPPVPYNYGDMMGSYGSGMWGNGAGMGSYGSGMMGGSGSGMWGNGSDWMNDSSDAGSGYNGMGGYGR